MPFQHDFLTRIVNVHWKTGPVIGYVVNLSFFPWEDAENPACSPPDPTAGQPFMVGTSFFVSGLLRYNLYAYPNHLMGELKDGFSVSGIPELGQSIGSDIGGGYNNNKFWDDLGPNFDSNGNKLPAYEIRKARVPFHNESYAQTAYYQEIIYTKAAKTYLRQKPSTPDWQEAGLSIKINWRGAVTSGSTQCSGLGTLYLLFDTRTGVRDPNHGTDTSVIKSSGGIDFSRVTVTHTRNEDGKTTTDIYKARTLTGHPPKVGWSDGGVIVNCFRDEDVERLDGLRGDEDEFPLINMETILK